MGNQHLFASLSRKQDGTVPFGDNGIGKIVGIGNISKPPSTDLKNILLIDSLKANLISVSQLCNRDFDVTCKYSKFLIVNNDGELICEANMDRNIYTIEFNDLSNQSVACLSALNQEACFWYKRLRHAKIELIGKIN